MKDKLAQLASIWGMSVEELLKQYNTDSLAPAICMNEECDYASELEPDCEDGYCEECQEKSMKSALVLGGFV